MNTLSGHVEKRKVGGCGWFLEKIRSIGNPKIAVNVSGKKKTAHNRSKDKFQSRRQKKKNINLFRNHHCRHHYRYQTFCSAEEGKLLASFHRCVTDWVSLTDVRVVLFIMNMGFG